MDSGSMPVCGVIGFKWLFPPEDGGFIWSLEFNKSKSVSIKFFWMALDLASLLSAKFLISVPIVPIELSISGTD